MWSDWLVFCDCGFHSVCPLMEKDKRLWKLPQGTDRPEHSFIERTDAEAEAPVLWPPDVKNWLIWKDPDAGKDWRWEEKGMAEDEMVGWHHRLNGHEFEKAPGVGDGQGSLGVLQSMGLQKVGHNWVTELNWTEEWICLPTTSPVKLKRGESSPFPKAVSKYLQPVLFPVYIDTLQSLQRVPDGRESEVAS